MRVGATRGLGFKLRCYGSRWRRGECENPAGSPLLRRSPPAWPASRSTPSISCQLSHVIWHVSPGGGALQSIEHKQWVLNQSPGSGCCVQGLPIHAFPKHRLKGQRSCASRSLSPARFLRARHPKSYTAAPQLHEPRPRNLERQVPLGQRWRQAQAGESLSSISSTRAGQQHRAWCTHKGTKSCRWPAHAAGCDAAHSVGTASQAVGLHLIGQHPATHTQRSCCRTWRGPNLSRRLTAHLHCSWPQARSVRHVLGHTGIAPALRWLSRKACICAVGHP